jgi:hypothetical protein
MLKDIAHYVKLSLYCFSHAFKTGYVPIEFAAKNGVNTAKNLLKMTTFLFLKLHSVWATADQDLLPFLKVRFYPDKIPAS